MHCEEPLTSEPMHLCESLERESSRVATVADCRARIGVREEKEEEERERERENKLLVEVQDEMP